MKRVTYIDSAKGLCVLMIVCSHVGASVPIPMFHTAQTTAFFLLSGYFFKINGTFYERAKASAVRLLLPFAVFYVLSYLFFYLGIAVVPGFSEMTDARGVLDCFTQKRYFNGPLWFLLALFWVQIIIFGICNAFKNIVLQTIAILAMGGQFLVV